MGRIKLDWPITKRYFLLPLDVLLHLLLPRFLSGSVRLPFRLSLVNCIAHAHLVSIRLSICLPACLPSSQLGRRWLPADGPPFILSSSWTCTQLAVSHTFAVHWLREATFDWRIVSKAFHRDDRLSPGWIGCPADRPGRTAWPLNNVDKVIGNCFQSLASGWPHQHVPWRSL